MSDHNIALLAVQETGDWIPSPMLFTNYRVIKNKVSSYTGANGVALRNNGVALIIAKTLHPEHIPDLDEDNTDAIWAQCKLDGRRILVGSVYCRPIEGTTHLKRLLGNLEKAMAFKDKHKFTSVMIYGDFNSRHTDWGDHKTEARGRSLKSFVEKSNLTICSPFENTFSCDTGGSVIDLLLVQGDISRKVDTQWIDKNINLFTGAPRRGHHPVLHTIRSRGATENTREMKTDWKNADWEAWTKQVDEVISQWMINNPESEGEELWRKLLEVISQATNDHIPTKTISIHSQPFWNESLSCYSKAAQEARARFQNRSTPHNREELNNALKCFKDALVDVKNSYQKENREHQCERLPAVLEKVQRSIWS